MLKKHWFYEFSGAHPQPAPSQPRCGERTANCFSSKEGFIGNRKLNPLLCNPLKVLCQSMLLHQGCITRCTQHGSNKPDKSKASHQSNNATCNIQLTLPRPQSLRKVFAPSFPTADHSTKQILLKTYELNNKSTPNHAIQPKQSCS